jgi:hypothetical protein
MTNRRLVVATVVAPGMLSVAWRSNIWGEGERWEGDCCNAPTVLIQCAPRAIAAAREVSADI